MCLFGRKDGVKVKNLDSIHKIMPHLMDKRCDAEVYMWETFEITEVLKYLEEKNKDLPKEEQYTLFMAIITAIFKTFYNRPYLNRFVAGKQLYDRKELTASFIIKKRFEDKSEEAVYIYKANETDNLDTITAHIENEVKSIRKTKKTATDKIIDIITSGPRFITSFVVRIIKILDFYGKVPESITKTDPNYTSVLLTNLGSINCNQAYHHLNNYGTNSLVVAVGTIYEEDKKKYVDIGFTADERIADGFYFAKSIQFAKKILQNPKSLEDNLNTKIKE